MQDFTIIKGDSYYISVKLVDENDNQVDFQEGDKLIFSAKRKLKQETYDIQSISTSVNEGEMMIILNPTDTNIREGEYFYDIEYQDTNHDVYTLVRGTLTIDWGVTQDE